MKKNFLMMAGIALLPIAVMAETNPADGSMVGPAPDSRTWQQVGSALNVGGNTTGPHSVAASPVDGSLWVAYRKVVGGALTGPAVHGVIVEHFDGTNWVKVGDLSRYPVLPRIAVAQDGAPYVLLRSNDAPDAVVTWDGGRWIESGPTDLFDTDISIYPSDTASKSQFKPNVKVAPDGSLYAALVSGSRPDYTVSVARSVDGSWRLLGEPIRVLDRDPFPLLTIAPDGGVYVSVDLYREEGCGGHSHCAPHIRYGYQVLTWTGATWQPVGDPYADQRYEAWQYPQFGVSAQGVLFGSYQSPTMTGGIIVKQYK